MPVDLKVTGAEDLRRLSKNLRNAHKEVRAAARKRLKAAAEPLKGVAREAALRELPHRGGLNEFVAGSKFTVQVRASGVVRLVGKNGTHDLAAMDRGRVRHPVFGDKGTWVTQSIPPGWWTRALAAQAPKVRVQLVKVVDDLAKEVLR